MKAIFITGTDTDVGKTFVSSLLLQRLNQSGYKTFAIKPIASGCHYNNHVLENQDALILQEQASLKLDYDVVNPIAYDDPIAPHIAAEKNGQMLSGDLLRKTLLSSIQPNVDINLIEGVGGWAVPLNSNELLSDVVCSLNIPVILVVGMKLGCLNHAILTYQHCMQMNVPFLGWVANCVALDMRALEDNIKTLKTWIKAPCLGVVPYQCNNSDVLDIEPILRLHDTGVS